MTTTKTRRPRTVAPGHATKTAPAPAPAPEAPQPPQAVWGTWKTHGNPERFLYLGHSRRKMAEPQEVRAGTTNGGMLQLSTPDGKRLVVTVGNATRFWAQPLPAAGPAPEASAAGASPDGPCHLVLTKRTDGAVHKAGHQETSRTYRSRAAAQKEAERRSGDWDSEIVMGKAPVTIGKRPGEVAEPTSHTKAVRRAAGASTEGASAAKAAPRRRVSVQCKCGCGNATRPGSLFLQGHDARLVSLLAREYADDRNPATASRVLAEVAFSEPLTRKLTRSIQVADEKAAKAAAKAGKAA